MKNITPFQFWMTVAALFFSQILSFYLIHRNMFLIQENFRLLRELESSQALPNNYVMKLPH